jgi:UDP-GlcNAc:undecaprenyl-phosphate GlcNAc-1-phosphate transferase
MNTASSLCWISWAGAMGVVLLSVPVWRRVCERMAFVDAPGPRKLHTAATPLAGGLAVMGAILLCSGFLFTLHTEVREWVSESARMWTSIYVGAMLMTLVGILDDRHVLRPGPKFILQLAAALVVAASGLRVTLFVANPVFQYAVTVLWILTVINAFNFMDNMNGLCTGLGALSAATFAAAAGRHDQFAEVVFALMVCGALVGFLPYNYPRAKAFLGDAGSHLVGYCMAVLAMLPSFHTETDPRPLAVLKPLLILAVPLLDMAWMVIIRTRAGQPFYVGDTNHLSHRLVRSGMSPAGAVGLIWLMAAVGCLVALLL